MARINIDILENIELKWMEMGEFNSHNNSIYYCGQKSHRRNGVAFIINKRVWNTVLGFSFKNDKIILACFQSKPFKITVTQVYASSIDAKEAEVDQFCEDLQDLLQLITNKRCLFHHRGLECKSRKSRVIWNNRRVWPWSTKWSRVKANIILSGEHIGHSKHSFPTTQEMTLHVDITRW